MASDDLTGTRDDGQYARPVMKSTGGMTACAQLLSN